MPILKYTCNECGKEFAKIIVKPEFAPKECPVCGHEGIVEAGNAFKVDKEQIARAMGMSCDSCDEDAACAPSG